MAAKAILVVGGAGYIGSHVVRKLSQQGYVPIILDNLSYGHKEAIENNIFYHGELSDLELLGKIFKENQIDAVMHFSAFAYVGESVQFPEKYYRNNVVNTLGLLETMVRHEVKHFIFSSSCAVYGEPVRTPIDESHPCSPINPYGRTKLYVEEIAADLDRSYGLKTINFRYFNAAGADPAGDIGEDHDPETHLIPLVLAVALRMRKAISVFGNDYPTPDGTCIRDYVHVNDLATAHFMGLKYLQSENKSDVFNLGVGEGHSVFEVIETSRRVTGEEIPIVQSARRPGDPAVLVADGKKARSVLGWSPEFATLEDIIKTAWIWHSSHPGGFGKEEDKD